MISNVSFGCVAASQLAPQKVCHTNGGDDFYTTVENKPVTQELPIFDDGHIIGYKTVPVYEQPVADDVKYWNA